MKQLRWITGEPYGFAGTGASTRWCREHAGLGLDVHAVVPTMANAKAPAQRPLGSAGGNTG